MAARLSDRVKHFFTTNEFVCFTDLGYALGMMPLACRQSNMRFAMAGIRARRWN
jgi:beta-glucosidase/6-phospho-beta-glucosidase/beta-galactosidase